MSDQKACTEKFIDVDLDQWRRDINTFASTTHDALAAIVDEISNTVGGQTSPEKNKSRIKTTPKNRRSKPSSVSAKRDDQDTDKTKSPASSTREDRLATLKEQLAIRMAQTKSN